MTNYHAWMLVLSICGQTGGSLPGTEVPKLIDRSEVEATAPGRAALTYQDGFEDPTPAWQHEYSDSSINLITHDRTDRAFHEGRSSERFQFEAAGGSQFFVSYEVPRIPVTHDLTVSLFVKSNRKRVRLHARVVLPKDIDPETKAPSFLLVTGTTYEREDRWQKLELSDLLPAIERQVWVLRASTKRPVDIAGAYVERIVVNLMGGIGDAEVFLDDLAITPVPASVLDAGRANSKNRGAGQAAADSFAGMRAKGQSLRRVLNDSGALKKLIDGKRYVDWFPTAIDAPGADVGELRRNGFDALVEPFDADPKRLAEAVDKGFLLIPRVNSGPFRDDPRQILDRIAAYPYKNDVAFWHLGDHFGRERAEDARDAELDRVQKVISELKHNPRFTTFPKLATATIDGDLPRYSQTPKNMDAIGIQPKYWGTCQEPLESLDYLTQRRNLALINNANQGFWAWLPARPSREVVRNIWGDDTPPAWGKPRIMPEQLRLMTYTALSAGYRGLGFLADEDLTQPAGRALLIEMAFLNEEIDLCESILGRGKIHDKPYKLFDPDPPVIPPPGYLAVGRRPPKVKEFGPRVGLRASATDLERSPGGHKGTLILITDFADGAQYQPSQMAARDVSVTLPLPASAQVYEITPGYVKLLEQKRPPGGRRITIPDFAVSTILLATTDPELPGRIEKYVARVRPLAAQLAIEQAEILYRDVAEVHDHLVADGHQLLSAKDVRRRREAGIEGVSHDARDLFNMSQESIKAAREAVSREDYELAWTEARGASRPLRILMRGFWNNATAELRKTAKAGFATADTLPDEEDMPPPPRGLTFEQAKARKEQEELMRRREIPIIVQANACPPAVTFNTLRELYVWLDWIGRGKFSRNLIPGGSFDDDKLLVTNGWTSVGYTYPGFESKIRLIADKARPDNLNLKLSVKPEKPEETDELPPYLDFPGAAIQSPPIAVQAKNLIRISVLVKRPIASVGGAGGVIIRDSIGGEQFQFRSSAAMPRFTRVVLFRKAPADMKFTVTLGLAGHGDAFFDDLQVQVVEEIDFGPVMPTAPPEREPIVRQQPRSPVPPRPETATRPARPRR